MFTSESVTEGHPDKVADRIADAILDALLARNPTTRSAVEAFITKGLVVIGGEVSMDSELDARRIAREAIESIGYGSADDGFDCDSAEFQVILRQQACEIYDQVDGGGAGDQGMMFGYACDETPELMPTAIVFAHRLAARLAEVRKSGILPYLRPDGKTQVTVEYDDSGRPVRVAKVLISAQHSPDVDLETLRREVVAAVVSPVIQIDHDTIVRVNPNGSFEVGGPGADTGLTGRKIIVDTYGGYARHGGGSFSGKDPTKVDRSAAYMMRYVAKNVVAAGLAQRCEVQVSYGIGDRNAFSLKAETFGTGAIPDKALAGLIREHFDLSPAGIIETLDLRRPIYTPLSAYGHFGREGVPWEKTDRTETLKSTVQIG
ncbi:MAG: methionine adenosyltransferase [Armatimonadetes bacterium]|nr:methionine adenosyltransferase [Armatimonadota bacterium]